MPPGSAENAPRFGTVTHGESWLGLSSNAAVHYGVVCDASGMKPLVGTRFKMMTTDYDLCEAEFLKLPEAERDRYAMVARPGSPPVPYTAQGLAESNAPAGSPKAAPALLASSVAAPPPPPPALTQGGSPVRGGYRMVDAPMSSARAAGHFTPNVVAGESWLGIGSGGGSRAQQPSSLPAQAANKPPPDAPPAPQPASSRPAFTPNVVAGESWLGMGGGSSGAPSSAPGAAPRGSRGFLANSIRASEGEHKSFWGAPPPGAAPAGASRTPPPAAPETPPRFTSSVAASTEVAAHLETSAARANEQAKLAEAMQLLGEARAEANKANAAADEAREMSARLLSALQASASEVKAEAERMRKDAN